MRLPCHFPGQQRTCRWSVATVSPRIQISDEIISSPRASEVHPRSSIQPSKLGGTASCSHTCTVERSGQMGVAITTGLSDCWAALTQRSLPRDHGEQQQQHAADHMPMIATWRAYDHCEQLGGLPHDAMPAPDQDQPIPAAGRGPAASSGVCPRSRRTNPARCRGASAARRETPRSSQTQSLCYETETPRRTTVSL